MRNAQPFQKMPVTKTFLDSMMARARRAAFRIVPREKNIRIVGVIESDSSAGTCADSAARAFIFRFKTAEQLHGVSRYDLQPFSLVILRSLHTLH